MTCSCPSVKGYGTKKSSVFSPNGAKYGMQSLVHNHMMAHYKLIGKAKSSIDNKPPKSMHKFIKVHSKKVATKKFKEKQRRLECDSLVSETLSKSQNEPSYDDIILNNATTYSFPVSIGSNSSESKMSQLKRSSTNLPHPKMYPSYTLEKEYLNGNHFSDEYEPEKSFVNKISSSSISYKKPITLNNRNRTSTPAFKTEMYIPPKDNKPNSNLQSFLISTQSQRLLASSCDDDLLRKSLKIKKNNEKLLQDISRLSLNESKWNVFTNKSSSGLFKRVGKTILDGSFQQFQKQEELLIEEQMYLNFVEDVTNDVLTRGIFSDRVLCQVFDTHIARNKHILNEERMTDLIEELKLDLNMCMINE